MVGRAIPMLAAAVLLAGCYLPVRFDAEITIDRSGYYNAQFDGYMVSVPLYQGLKDGTISALDEKAKIADLQTDVTRDSAISDFKYVRQGHFRLKWRDKGDLIKTRMVTFLRRSESILNLKYVKSTRLITVEATPIADANARRLKAEGLDMQGQLRVRTDARVVTHNAGRVIDDKAGRGKVYIWEVKSVTDAPPRIVIAPG